MEPGPTYRGDFRDDILNKYHALLERPLLAARNPCSLPTSLLRNDISVLMAEEYVVADKSDGVRFTLFLTTAGDNETAVFIDRKLKLYQVPVAATRSAFQGTIFDGELVAINEDGEGVSHCFLVFDVLAFRGSSDISRENLLRRLEIIRSALDVEGECLTSPADATRLAKQGRIICGGSRNGLFFKPKPCFQFSDLDVLVRNIKQLPYPADGIIFTPIQEPVRLCSAPKTFKLKTRHTIDLEIQDGKLLVGMGGGRNTATRRMDLEEACPEIRYSQALLYNVDKLATSPTCAVPLIVEFAVEGEDPYHLVSGQVRSDKTHPNTAAVVRTTVENIREKITVEEILQYARQKKMQRGEDARHESGTEPRR